MTFYEGNSAKMDELRLDMVELEQQIQTINAGRLEVDTELSERNLRDLAQQSTDLQNELTTLNTSAENGFTTSPEQTLMDRTGIVAEQLRVAQEQEAENVKLRERFEQGWYSNEETMNLDITKNTIWQNYNNGATEAHNKTVELSAQIVQLREELDKLPADRIAKAMEAGNAEVGKERARMEETQDTRGYAVGSDYTELINLQTADVRRQQELIGIKSNDLADVNEDIARVIAQVGAQYVTTAQWEKQAQLEAELTQAETDLITKRTELNKTRREAIMAGENVFGQQLADLQEEEGIIRGQMSNPKLPTFAKQALSKQLSQNISDQYQAAAGMYSYFTQQLQAETNPDEIKKLTRKQTAAHKQMIDIGNTAIQAETDSAMVTIDALQLKFNRASVDSGVIAKELENAIQPLTEADYQKYIDSLNEQIAAGEKVSAEYSNLMEGLNSTTEEYQTYENGLNSTNETLRNLNQTVREQINLQNDVSFTRINAQLDNYDKKLNKINTKQALLNAQGFLPTREYFGEIIQNRQGKTISAKEGRDTVIEQIQNMFGGGFAVNVPGIIENVLGNMDFTGKMYEGIDVNRLKVLVDAYMSYNDQIVQSETEVTENEKLQKEARLNMRQQELSAQQAVTKGIQSSIQAIKDAGNNVSDDKFAELTKSLDDQIPTLQQLQTEYIILMNTTKEGSADWTTYKNGLTDVTE